MEKKVKDVQNVENSLKKVEALRRDLLGNLSGLSFDYNSGLIEFVCGGKKESKKKWTSICKASRDKKNNPFSKLKIATLILEINEEWLDKLYSYRSQLIHYKSELGGNMLRQNLMSGESEIRVNAPLQFIKKFPELNNFNSRYDITLRYVSFWLVTKAFSDTIKIIRKIRDFMDYHRIIPECEQPVTFNRKGDIES